jgi:hypothetical protein
MSVFSPPLRIYLTTDSTGAACAAPPLAREFEARVAVAGKTWGLSGQLDGQIGRLHKPAAPYSVFFWHC